MTNKAGATKAQIAPFLRESQQLVQTKMRQKERQKKTIITFLTIKSYNLSQVKVTQTVILKPVHTKNDNENYKGLKTALNVREVHTTTKIIQRNNIVGITGIVHRK